MPTDFCETITESEDFNVGWVTESQVDEATGVIRNVPLCGNVSKNGYDIPPSAFGSDAKVQALYEGKPVCLNHRQGAAKQRDLEELAAYARNTRFVNGRPWGDLHTEGCPKGAILLGLAKGKVPNVGLSHSAIYRFNKGRTSVESVETVFTVDAVLYPATTKSFTEQDSGGDKQMSVETVDLLATQLKEQRESFEAKFIELNKKVSALEADKTALESSLKTATSERDAASAKVVSYETAKALADRRAAVVESCKKAGIDTANDKVCPNSWLNYVCSIESEADQKKAISEHAELVKGIAPANSGPTSQERQSGSTEWSAKAALESVRFVN